MKRPTFIDNLEISKAQHDKVVAYNLGVRHGRRSMLIEVGIGLAFVVIGLFFAGWL